mmetsp:Transcript_12372/g.23699  ORF Transcript_12372/g.23699 Transcript_12372/m.23699 type:complete len:232 (-) Transcript_12372:708-1403(-)
MISGVCRQFVIYVLTFATTTPSRHNLIRHPTHSLSRPVEHPGWTTLNHVSCRHVHGATRKRLLIHEVRSPTSENHGMLLVVLVLELSHPLFFALRKTHVERFVVYELLVHLSHSFCRCFLSREVHKTKPTVYAVLHFHHRRLDLPKFRKHLIQFLLVHIFWKVLHKQICPRKFFPAALLFFLVFLFQKSLPNLFRLEFPNVQLLPLDLRSIQFKGFFRIPRFLEVYIPKPL